jgi:hypothetical protein
MLVRGHVMVQICNQPTRDEHTIYNRVDAKSCRIGQQFSCLSYTVKPA